MTEATWHLALYTEVYEYVGEEGGLAMVTTPKTIQLAPGSELARILDEADNMPLILERDGVRYHISRVEQESSILVLGRDAEMVRRVLDETVGSWADVDADELIAELYRAREEGCRPAGEP